jgi:hypothetical protein
MTAEAMGTVPIVVSGTVAGTVPVISGIVPVAIWRGQGKDNCIHDAQDLNEIC